MSYALDRLNDIIKYKNNNIKNIQEINQLHKNVEEFTINGFII